MSAIPTPLDEIHAMMYALDRIAKERCQDPDIVKKYPGITWQSRDNNRIYPCPAGATGCEHGVCRITTKELCDANSQVPWKSNGSTNSDTITCKTKDDCKNVGYPADCYNGKCGPANPYLEWHPNTYDPDKSMCVVGNAPLRRWCEYPSVRRQDAETGVTDVPPFVYDENTGTCSITPAYCAWMGQDYIEKDSNGVPSCDTSTGQDIGEFVVGKTIFRGLKRTIESFDTLPQQVVKSVDETDMITRVLQGKDFGGPGINLYQIFWKDGTQSSGFISSEIESKYPTLIKMRNNKKHLVISRSDIGGDKYKKRLYLTGGSGSWILESILKFQDKK